MDIKRIEEIGRELLIAIGEDPDREGLQETPKRWAKWWKEFIDYEAGNISTTFSHDHYDQMVVVSDLRIWTLCEHHLLPFYCDASIGYVADGRVIGLSKIARIAQQCAHRLQLQEQLAQQIADELGQQLSTEDVAVVLKGEHLCMTTRGIKMPGTMSTSVLQGHFREASVREEFLRLAGI